jgi:hypothetical protein
MKKNIEPLGSTLFILCRTTLIINLRKWATVGPLGIQSDITEGLERKSHKPGTTKNQFLIYTLTAKDFMDITTRHSIPYPLN